jgi:ribosomal protein S18 acetylase RimI-like enzyme
MQPRAGSVIQGRFAACPSRLACTGHFGHTVQLSTPRRAGRPGPAQAAGGGTRVIPLPPHLAAFSARAQPLPPEVRHKMESFFGADLGAVRVHVGPEATRLGALAFTQGEHIWFAPGQYNPHTVQGQQLLGHELAHVQQQRAGRVRSPYGSGVAIVQDAALEAEAERTGRLAAAHRPVQRSAAPGAGVLSAPAGRGQVHVYAGPRERSVGSANVRGDGGAAVEITDLRVDPEHRKRGLGAALLSSAMQAGLRMGRRTVRLSSQDDGSGRLTAWYRSMGFRPVGTDARGLTRLEAPIRSVLPRLLQAKPAPPELRGGTAVALRRVVQRASAYAPAKLSLAQMAAEVHELSSDNARAKAATTIAFANTTDGLICTTNDVGKVSKEAVQRAVDLGAPEVDQAGAGFHAEMWMVIRGFDKGLNAGGLSGWLTRVGASRACCKQCSAVLTLCGVQMDQHSNDEYQSWVNPLTTDETSQPRAGWEASQRRDIPDFRQRGTNYWWTSDKGGWTKDARGK